MAFLTTKQLSEMKFLSIGENVLISERTSIYGASRIRIGNNVRIDDFCILSAGEEGICLGNHVHIGCYTSLIGKSAISLGDFSGLSSRVSIYSSSDDYSGDYLTNPTVPEVFTNVDHRPVTIGRHCNIGAGAVILPGVTMGEGCAVGALSLVTRNCQPFGTYFGIPAQLIRQRSQKLLDHEKALLDWKKSQAIS